MNSNMPKISGPFGNCDAQSLGGILNSLCAAGVPLTTVERVTVDNSRIMLGEELFACYKFFDGIIHPLFRFNQLVRLNEQLLAIDTTNRTLHPQFKLVLSNHDTPGLIFNGSVATPELHEFLQRTLTNWMNDPWYEVHKTLVLSFKVAVKIQTVVGSILSFGDQSVLKHTLINSTQNTNLNNQFSGVNQNDN